MEIYVALAKAGLVAVPINFRLVAPGDPVHRRALRGTRIHRRGRAGRSRRSRCAASSRSRPADGSTSAILRRRAGPATRRSLAGAADAEPGAAVQSTDTWALMYTSGTTGRPKGAIRNHRGQRSDLARHGARHGPHARRHGAAGDADVPRQLAVLRVHVHLPGRDLSSSTTARASIRRRCWPRWPRSTSRSPRSSPRTTS